MSKKHIQVCTTATYPFQRCSNRMCRDSNPGYCPGVILYNHWFSEWGSDPEAVPVQGWPRLALLQLCTHPASPIASTADYLHLLSGPKQGLRPLPTVVSVASPNVLQATAGIKYSMLDSVGALRAICRSKAHTGDSRDPGTSPDSLLSQINNNNRYLRCSQEHTRIVSLWNVLVLNTLHLWVCFK